MPEESPWILKSRDTGYEVVISGSALAETTVGPGESVAVRGGEITIVDLRLWMGYRIDYNPLLPWILTAAFLSLGALAVHMAQKFRVPRASEPVPVHAGERAA